MDELRWLDATEVAALIAAGSVSVAEVLEASLARVEARHAMGQPTPCDLTSPIRVFPSTPAGLQTLG